MTEEILGIHGTLQNNYHGGAWLPLFFFHCAIIAIKPKLNQRSSLPRVFQE